jgi:hypothetical protein
VALDPCHQFSIDLALVLVVRQLCFFANGVFAIGLFAKAKASRESAQQLLLRKGAPWLVGASRSEFVGR